MQRNFAEEMSRRYCKASHPYMQCSNDLYCQNYCLINFLGGWNSILYRYDENIFYLSGNERKSNVELNTWQPQYPVMGREMIGSMGAHVLQNT